MDPVILQSFLAKEVNVCEQCCVSVSDALMEYVESKYVLDFLPSVPEKKRTRRVVLKKKSSPPPPEVGDGKDEDEDDAGGSFFLTQGSFE
jgi:hypothetical protein